MDFAPEETHLAFQRMANDFARQEILPAVEEIDREKDPAVRFPAVLLEKGSRLGLRTLALPEEGGGGGADLLTLCFVGEELGWGDLGIASTFAQDWCVSHTLAGICGDAQFAEFSSRFTIDHAAHLTRAELSANPPAESRMPYVSNSGCNSGEKADENIPAGAASEGNGWVLSGFASHVMNGAAARWILVSFDSEITAGENGRRAFLVDTAAGGGARIVRHHDPMGMRACQDADLAFENLKVSEESHIPCETGAWAKNIPAFCALPASAALGCARRANEQATDHARERVQGGKPIIEHQTVGFMLAENLMELNAARRALHAAAWAADQDAPDLRESYLTQVFVSEACERIARRSMEVWGGAGYMTEAPMERFVRDMTSFMHAGEMMNSLRVRVMKLI